MKLFFTTLLICYTLFTKGQNNMAYVAGGKFIPLYGSVDKKPIPIAPFLMDKTPVTNQEFLDFLIKYPTWQRQKVKKIFAGENYLEKWTSDTNFPKELQNSPVTQISWFAAKEYCECEGKRLPTLNEWEFAAMASQTEIDARKNEDFTREILSGYETPNTYKKEVGISKPNYWGIYDLHNMVWEWTLDFNSIMISGENRDKNNTNLFCGAGALGADDLMNYAAFMRYAFRSSIQANFSINSLGFRCALDIKEKI
ncbi:MAG: hypothetical protein COZ75_05720 [Flavobacteriaceae bacterium CG_4_8_14_3_um_filter_34_10]|nr:MAG: hypothetical protein COS19_00070 [Flavobacteriaceae bacterium CG02_land_8_20_14_3_00_34_13]PIX09627.1 MAG: hypothetical protein COZ75_05720 [Flavobacteriaceae bacterium CG_4_8_14_3_um_filter_34_10]